MSRRTALAMGVPALAALASMAAGSAWIAYETRRETRDAAWFNAGLVAAGIKAGQCLSDIQDAYSFTTPEWDLAVDLALLIAGGALTEGAADYLIPRDLDTHDQDYT